MKIFITTSLLLLLTACTTITEKHDWPWSNNDIPAEVLWQQRQTDLKALDNWAFRGRTLIKQDKEGWNAGVNWTQQDDKFDIRLSGPFAQGAVELRGDQYEVQMTTAEGDTYTAETPEALLNDVLGWRLPVSALRDWVRGLPYAQQEMTAWEVDAEGRLIKLQQAGWQVEFLRYVPFAGVEVPDKIFIEHPELNVRLVVSSWRQP